MLSRRNKDSDVTSACSTPTSCPRPNQNHSCRPITIQSSSRRPILIFFFLSDHRNDRKRLCRRPQVPNTGPSGTPFRRDQPPGPDMPSNCNFFNPSQTSWHCLPFLFLLQFQYPSIFFLWLLLSIIFRQRKLLTVYNGSFSDRLNAYLMFFFFILTCNVSKDENNNFHTFHRLMHTVYTILIIHAFIDYIK